MRKRDLVVRVKVENPGLSLREVAERVGCSYDYARHVWSGFLREQVSKRGVVVPFGVKAWFYWNELPPRWGYECCPVEPSGRNRQKVYRGKRFTCVFHKGGSVFVYPYFMGWRDELKGWLESWMDGELVELFMNSLVEHGKREYYFHTPGIPKKVRIRIRGVGTFMTDSTPYPDGTTEFVLDAGFEKRFRKVEERLNVLYQSQVTQGQLLRKFSDGLIILIAKLEEFMDSLKKVMEKLEGEIKVEGGKESG